MTNGEHAAIMRENTKAVGNAGSGSNSVGNDFSPGGFITSYPKGIKIAKSKDGRKTIQTPTVRMNFGFVFLYRSILSKSGSIIHSFFLKSLSRQDCSIMSGAWQTSCRHSFFVPCCARYLVADDKSFVMVVPRKVTEKFSKLPFWTIGVLVELT
jgi:hypothetical protein